MKSTQAYASKPHSLRLLVNVLVRRRRSRSCQMLLLNPKAIMFAACHSLHLNDGCCRIVMVYLFSNVEHGSRGKHASLGAARTHPLGLSDGTLLSAMPGMPRPFAKALCERSPGKPRERAHTQASPADETPHFSEKSEVRSDG